MNIARIRKHHILHNSTLVLNVQVDNFVMRCRTELKERTKLRYFDVQFLLSRLKFKSVIFEEIRGYDSPKDVSNDRISCFENVELGVSAIL